MNPVSRLEPASPTPPLRRVLAPIGSQLEAVEARLRRELASGVPAVDRLLEHGWAFGGKRLRPALLLLAGTATGRLQPAHTTLAVVVEMIHLATLVHDDVLDGATLRRHRPTVNARWGNHTSVLLGDYLFSHAFYLAATLESTEACQWIGRTTNRVCEGEIRQNDMCGRWDLSEEEYFSIIEAKTAALCACACRLGAAYAGASPEITSMLERYGNRLGLAFQVADDVLDWTGHESEMGKTLGTDAAQGKPTLPLIRFLATADKDRSEAVRAHLESGKPEAHQRLVRELEQSGALAYAVQRAEALAAEARQLALALPASPARETLADLTRHVVTRRQ